MMKRIALSVIFIMCFSFVKAQHTIRLAHATSSVSLNFWADNYMEIYKEKNDSIAVSAGVLKKEKEKNIYTWGQIPDSIDRCTLTFWNNKKKVKEQLFAVKRLNVYVTYVGNSGSKGMSAAQARVGAGLNALIPFGGCSIDAMVSYFKVIRIGTDNTRIESENHGPVFSAESKKIMQMAKPGDIYIFSNIIVKSITTLYSPPNIMIEIY